MAELVSLERLAEVKAAYDRSLYESMSIGPSLMTAWSAVPELLAAAQRTLQAEAAVVHLRARVTELTALLNDPHRLDEHARELRAIYFEADALAEVDRLAAGGEV